MLFRLRIAACVMLVAMVAMSISFMMLAYRANRIIFWMVLLVVGIVQLLAVRVVPSK